MAAWDKDLDQPAPAWEKDLDRPEEPTKETKKKKRPTVSESIGPEFQTYGNLLAGAVRGAGSIGATILGARDAAEQGIANLMGAKGYVAGVPNRRAEMTNALQSLGAEPESMAFQGGQLGGEIAGTLGVPFASAQKMSYIPRIGANALSGAAAAGMIDPESMGTGAMIGGGLTAIGAPIAAAGKHLYNQILSPAMNLLPWNKAGAQNIVRNHLANLVGEKQLPATIAAADRARPFVPGYPQNLDEAMTSLKMNPVTRKLELAFLPEGSPLSAMQKIEAAQPGGASAIFGQREGAQKLALEAAEQARNVAAKPLRDTSMRSANMAGGVDSGPISAKIQSMMAQPENYGAPAVKDVLSGIKSDLDDIIAMGQGGRVDAEAIYAMRKDLGKKIQSIANSKNITFDKGITARLADDIQSTIDQELNNAVRASGIPDVSQGMTVYDKYMKDFAKSSEKIRLTKEAKELAASPPQKTSISGGRDVAGDITPQVANMLSRPVMMSNWTLRLLGKAKEPAVDEALARILTNPQEYSRVMRTLKPLAQTQIVQLLGAARNPLIAVSASQE